MDCSILIVDDSATTRALIRRAITLAGVTGQISEAADGKSALASLAAQKIDLVFADLHMPEMDGVEMTQRILADERTRHIPVVIISAEPDAQKIEALRQQGARGYLRKPFRPEDIRRVIHDVLGAANHA